MSSPFDSDNDNDNEDDQINNIQARSYEQQQQQQCCPIGRMEINHAERVQDHVEYTIAVNEKAVQRRYSDFESLRKILKRLYPHLIVPPIPQKHSLYASITSNNKEREEQLIQLRKKMLLSFLRKINEHPVLSQEHLFHRFLEQGPWSDVLFSSNLASPSKSASLKQKLSLNKKLRNPDMLFLNHDEAAQTYLTAMQSLEKAHKRVTKNVEDLQLLYNELGLVFNGVALNTTSEGDGAVSELLENVGGAFDSLHDGCQIHLNGMEDLSISFSEYAQYNQVVVDLLKTRHQRHVQLEDLGDQLDQKRTQLNNLEKGSQTLAAGSGFFGGLGDKLHQMIDQDPDSTRRNNIAKVKEQIQTLEKERDTETASLQKFNEQLLQELTRFQDVKRMELKVLMDRYVKLHHSYYEKCAGVWKSFD